MAEDRTDKPTDPTPPPTREENLARVGRDTGTILGSTGVGRGLGFVFNFIVARVVGEALFGVWTLAQTIINYLVMLATFGLDQALVRFVSLHRGAHDPARVKGVMIQGLLVNLTLSLAGAAALSGLAPWICASFFPAQPPVLVTFLRWTAWSVPFIVLMNSLVGATQGYRMMRYTPLVRDVSYPLARVLLAVALLALGWRAWALVVTHVASSVVFGIVAVAVLIGVFRPILEQHRAVFEKGLLAYGFPLFLNDLLLKSFRWSDILFIGAFRGAGDIGVYRIAQICSEASRLVWGSFKTTIAPVIADLHHRGEAEELRHHFTVTSKWAFMASFPPLVFFSLLAKETLSVFGHAYAAGALCLVILNAGRIVAVSTGLVANLLVMSGHARWTLFNSVAGNAFNFLLNALLIPKYGILGAAVAFSLSTAVLNIVQMAEVRWLFGFFPWNMGYLKPLGACLLAGGAARLAAGALPWPPLALVAVCALLFLMVYIGALLALGLAPEDRLLVGQFVGRFRVKKS
jgi:O-antigen/teichoic acid export membrane protein